jgi:hypothetical protein
MSMPEATVHEDDGAEAPKYQIGTARQVFTVKAEAEPARMEAPAH